MFFYQLQMHNKTNHVYMCAAALYSIPSDKAKRLLCFTSFTYIQQSRFSIDVPDDPRPVILCCTSSGTIVYLLLLRLCQLYTFTFQFSELSIYILSGLSYKYLLYIYIGCCVYVQCLIYLYRSRVEDETIKSTNTVHRK